MKTCKQCKSQFPFRMVINNKPRNLKNRTKCLNCLPFGVSPYATSNLTEKERIERYRERKRKGSMRHYLKCKDQIEQRSKDRKQGLVNLIGGCQNCGYLKVYNLTFHHIDSNKDFNIDRRRCQYSWKSVKSELLKCVMLCHNCHGDAHHGDLNCSIMHDKILELITPLDDWPIIF